MCEHTKFQPSLEPQIMNSIVTKKKHKLTQQDTHVVHLPRLGRLHDDAHLHPLPRLDEVVVDRAWNYIHILLHRMMKNVTSLTG